MVTVESVKVIIDGEDNVSKVFDKVDKKSSSVFSSIGGAAKIGAAALAGVGIGAAVGIGKAIGEASDLGESINAVNVVFGEGAEEILKFSDAAATTVGLSKKAFNQLATETGTLVKATGLSMDETAEQTINLTKRAADLASVFNTDVETAMSAVNQAVRGETEAIRKFGADVTDNSLKQFALAQGIEKSVSEMTQQEKTMLRIQKIMADTDQVQGDFINTSDSLANQMRIAKSSFTDLTAEVGEVFLPIATEGITKVTEFVKGLKGFTTEGGAVSEVFTTMKDTIAGTFEFIGSAITTTFDFVQEIFNENKDFILDTFESIGDTIGGVFNLIGGVVKFFKGLWDNNFLGIQDSIMTSIAWLKFFGTVALETFGGVVDILGFLFNNWEYTWESIKLTTFNAINGMIGLIENFVNGIVNGVNKILPEFAKLDNVDLSGFKIDTEINEARVAALKPDQTLGETLAERGTRLEAAGTRLFDDLKKIEESKAAREEAQATRDQEMLEAFRASKTEVNIVDNTKIDASQYTPEELKAILDERDRRRLIEGGVTLA